MSRWLPPLALLLSLLCSPVRAQFVKGNEAVQPTPTGPKVETPSAPSAAGPVCAAAAKCHAGAWRMVETEDGLKECTEPWARPGSCRASSYGTQKLARVWVVKSQGQWAQCQYPSLTSICRPLNARPPENLPVDAVQ